LANRTSNVPTIRSSASISREWQCLCGACSCNMGLAHSFPSGAKRVQRCRFRPSKPLPGAALWSVPNAPGTRAGDTAGPRRSAFGGGPMGISDRRGIGGAGITRTPSNFSLTLPMLAKQWWSGVRRTKSVQFEPVCVRSRCRSTTHAVKYLGRQCAAGWLNPLGVDT